MSNISVLNLFFGIALFLFGMNLMSDHLKKISGSGAEVLLYRLTDKPLKGLLIGTGITALIQSSSAVSAMVVSLTESRIMKLKQAIPVIIGTILGTSATGWIIAYSSITFHSSNILKIFSASVLSAVFAITGIVLKLFIKKQQIKRLGEIFLGFAVLMLGIHTITEAVEPLKNNAVFVTSVSSFQNPLLLFVFGIALSALLQSASASVGILQTLSLSGLISLNTAVYLLLGIGIGASVPVIIASAGKSADAKRVSLIYLLCNTIGAVVIGAIYLILSYIIGFNNAQIILNSLQITTLNTVYRVLIVLILTPFTSVLEHISRGMIKEKKKLIVGKI